MHIAILFLGVRSTSTNATNSRRVSTVQLASILPEVTDVIARSCGQGYSARYRSMYHVHTIATTRAYIMVCAGMRRMLSPER